MFRPRLGLEPTRRRLAVPLWAAGIVVVWLAAIAFVEVRDAPMPAGGTLCGFRLATGVPCPTCGATRAVKAAWGGDLGAALAFNPFLVTAGAVAAALLILKVGFGRRVVVGPVSRRGRWAAWSVVAGLFVVNWVYLIVVDRL